MLVYMFFLFFVLVSIHYPEKKNAAVPSSLRLLSDEIHEESTKRIWISPNVLSGR